MINKSLNTILKLLLIVIIIGALWFFVEFGYPWLTRPAEPLPEANIPTLTLVPTIEHPPATALPQDRQHSVVEAITINVTDRNQTVLDVFGGDKKAFAVYADQYGTHNRTSNYLVTNQADALGQGSAYQVAYNVWNQEQSSGGIVEKWTTTRVSVDYGLLMDRILSDIEVETNEATGAITMTVTVHGCVVEAGVPITSLIDPVLDMDTDDVRKPSLWMQFRLWLSGTEYDTNEIAEISRNNAVADALRRILSNQDEETLHSTFVQSVEQPGVNHAHNTIKAQAIVAALDWVNKWCDENPEQTCPTVAEFDDYVNVIIKAGPQPTRYTFCGVGGNVGE